MAPTGDDFGAGGGQDTSGSAAHRRVYTSSRRSRRAAKAATRSRAQRWRRRILGTLAGVLVVVPTAGFGAWWYLNYRLGQVHHVTIEKGVLHVSKPGAPFNMLLIGSDTRKFEKTGAQAGKFGSASVVTGQRSDVIIIARIIPATKQVYMLSIPRDLWVDIPGHVQYISGQNKINAAFNAGPSLLIKTLRKDFGIPVDHFAEVNFAGFQGMVQAVGGLRINFPMPIKDAYSGLSIRHTGCQTISGGMALAFVRSRHLYYYSQGQWNYDGLSDWSRIRRQDVFFQALLRDVKGQVTNPVAMNNVLDAVVHNLTIDSTLSNSELIHLAVEFRHIGFGAIHTEVLPTIPKVLPTGIDALMPATNFDHTMIEKFLAEGTSQKVATAHTGRATTTIPGTTSSTTTTTTVPSNTANVVFDTQPEPWNGTPC